MKFKQKRNQAQNRGKIILFKFEFILKYERGLLWRHVLNPNNRWNNLAIGKICQLWLFTQVAYSTERKECQHFLHRCGVKAIKIDRANEFTKTSINLNFKGRILIRNDTIIKMVGMQAVPIHPSIHIFFFYSQVKSSKNVKVYWTF